MSAKFRCYNQCTRQYYDRKDTYPVLLPKEHCEARVADILSAIHSVSNPAVPFNPAVFMKDFDLENFLNHLLCNVVLLVGTEQELWEKYPSLVPLKILNCIQHIISFKMQDLGIKTLGIKGLIKENAKLLPCLQ